MVQSLVAWVEKSVLQSQRVQNWKKPEEDVKKRQIAVGWKTRIYVVDSENVLTNGEKTWSLLQ